MQQWQLKHIKDFAAFIYYLSSLITSSIFENLTWKHRRNLGSADFTE